MSVAGKIGRSFFFFIFFMFGIGFIGLMTYTLYKDIAAASWQETPCVITESKIDNSSEKYKLTLKYDYTYNGKQYTSDILFRNYNGDDDYSEADVYANSFAKNSKTLCYVNPENPSEAVLIQKIQWEMLPMMIIPLIFVAVGLGGIYFTWKKKAPGKTLPDSYSRLAKESKKDYSVVVLFLFFSVFLLFGLGFLYMILLRPAIKINEAKSWEEVPCKIISSRVKSHSDDDGTTYSVDILFRYTYKGKKYKSNQYSFSTGSSSGYEGKKEIVDKYPRRTKSICYVNPDNPSEAVINRGYTSDMLFAIIPLIFVAVGLGGIIYALFYAAKKKNQAKLTDTYKNSDSVTDNRYSGRTYEELPESDSGPLVLKQDFSLVSKIIGGIFIALFWNGIVSVFLYQLYKSFNTGHPDLFDWFHAIFMIPFVVIGIAIILGVIYTIMQLKNPRVTLELSSSLLYPGKTFDLKWEMNGRTERISSFSISLVGYEEASYRRGTSTTTANSCFEEIKIFETDNWSEMEYGKKEFNIPADTMHSFSGEHNKLKWVIETKGDIKFWPDIADTFTLEISPAPPDKIPAGNADTDSGSEVVEIAETDDGGIVYKDVTESVDIPESQDQKAPAIILEKTLFRPGEKLSGKVIWDFDTIPKDVEIALFWHTEGRGDEDGEIYETTVIPVETSSGEYEFSFILPYAPYSFSGKLISLVWSLEFTGETPYFALKKEIVISPAARIIALKTIEGKGFLSKLGFFRK